MTLIDFFKGLNIFGATVHFFKYTDNKNEALLLCQDVDESPGHEPLSDSMLHPLPCFNNSDCVCVCASHFTELS